MEELEGRRAGQGDSPEIEIHCTGGRDRVPGAEVRDQVNRAVPSWQTTVVLWKEFYFHNRIIIVDDGGVGLAWGLGIDDVQDNDDVLFLLARNQTAEIVKKFAPDKWPSTGTFSGP